MKDEAIEMSHVADGVLSRRDLRLKREGERKEVGLCNGVATSHLRMYARRCDWLTMPHTDTI